MTLIEVMIALLIVAMASTAAYMSLGAVTKTKLRSASMKVVSSARYAYARAVSRGTTVRLLFDTDANTMVFEEAHGRVALARKGDARREDMDETDEAAVAVDPWEAAQQRLKRTLEPSFGASPFGALKGRDGDVLSRYRSQPVGDNIQVARLYLPHEPGVREQGKGAIYFFPSGMTEHAVVQLSDSTDTVYSVEIHPLTGRAKVHRFAFEPEPIRDDADEEDLSEVEDPG